MTLQGKCLFREVDQKFAKNACMHSISQPQAMRLCALDRRSLVALRIVVALCVLYDLIERADTLEFYTSGAPGSCIQPPQHTQHHAPPHLLWFYRGSIALQMTLFATAAAAAASLGCGPRPGASALLCWASLVGIQGRAECVNDGSDKLLRNVLLWCVVLPLEEPPPSGGAATMLVSSAATAGLTLQLAGMYAALLVQRWDAPGWWAEQSAVHYALVSPFASTALGRRAAALPGLTRCLTTAGLGAELLAPLLLLVSPASHPLRLLPVALLAGMHGGVRLLLRLPGFTRIAAGVMLAFVPSHTWEALGWHAPPPASPPATPPTSPHAPPPAPPQRHLAAAAAAVTLAAAFLATHTPLLGGGEGWPAFSPAVAAVLLTAVLTAAASAAAPSPAPSPTPASTPAPAPAPALALAPALVPQPPLPPPGRAERVRSVAARLMVAYMLHLLIAEALLLPKLDGGDVTTTTKPTSPNNPLAPVMTLTLIPDAGFQVP